MFAFFLMSLIFVFLYFSIINYPFAKQEAKITQKNKDKSLTCMLLSLYFQNYSFDEGFAYLNESYL